MHCQPTRCPHLRSRSEDRDQLRSNWGGLPDKARDEAVGNSNNHQRTSQKAADFDKEIGLFSTVPVADAYTGGSAEDCDDDLKSD
jgi:hypothetical protein